MSEEETIRIRQLGVDAGDERKTDLSTEPTWMRAGKQTLPGWVMTSWGESDDSITDRDEWQRDRERIACLECIIAILIEKNERIRQQLTHYMD